MNDETVSAWEALLEGGGESEVIGSTSITISKEIFDILSMLKFFTLNSDERKTWNRYFNEVIPVLMEKCDPDIFKLAESLVKSNPRMKFSVYELTGQPATED